MKKLSAIALFLLTITALPGYAQEVATIKQIQLEEGVTATKTVTITRAGKVSTLATNAEVKVNDVLEIDNKSVIVKMQNGATWTLDEKTKFSIADYQANKAVYVLIEGDANYQAGKKAPEATIKINNKDYLASAGANLSVSYDNEVTLLIVRAGSVKVANQVVSQGNRVTINAQGEVHISKDRGIRGHSEDIEDTVKKGQYEGIRGHSEEKKE